MMRVTDAIVPSKAEKHHVKPLGMGGSKVHRELYEYRMLAWNATRENMLQDVRTASHGFRK